MSNGGGPIRVPLTDVMADPEMNRVLQYCLDTMVILRTSLFLRDMTIKTWGMVFGNVIYIPPDSRALLHVFKVGLIDYILRDTMEEWPALSNDRVKLFCNEFGIRSDDDFRDEILMKFEGGIENLKNVMIQSTRMDDILTEASEIMTDLMTIAKKDEKRGIILACIDFIRVSLLYRLKTIANAGYSNDVLRFVVGLYPDIDHEIHRLEGIFKNKVAHTPWPLAPIDMMSMTIHVVEYTRSQAEQVEEAMRKYIDYSVTCSNIVCRHVYSLVFNTTNRIEFTEDYMTKPKQQHELHSDDHETNSDHATESIEYQTLEKIEDSHHKTTGAGAGTVTTDDISELRLKDMMREILQEFDIPRRMELMQEAIDGLAEKVARWGPQKDYREEGGFDRRMREVDDTVRNSKGRLV